MTLPILFFLLKIAAVIVSGCCLGVILGHLITRKTIRIEVPSDFKYEPIRPEHKKMLKNKELRV